MFCRNNTWIFLGRGRGGIRLSYSFNDRLIQRKRIFLQLDVSSVGQDTGEKTYLSAARCFQCWPRHRRYPAAFLHFGNFQNISMPKYGRASFQIQYT
jgi:hypothetical protein